MLTGFRWGLSAAFRALSLAMVPPSGFHLLSRTYPDVLMPWLRVSR